MVVIDCLFLGRHLRLINDQGFAFFSRLIFQIVWGGIEQVIFQLCEGGPAHGIDAEVLYVSKHESCRAVPIGNHVSHRSAQKL